LPLQKGNIYAIANPKSEKIVSHNVAVPLDMMESLFYAKTNGESLRLTMKQTGRGAPGKCGTNEGQGSRVVATPDKVIRRIKSLGKGSESYHYFIKTSCIGRKTPQLSFPDF
jgi:hypothetical protein